MSDILNSEKVNAIFLDCLFKDGEDTSNYVKAEGIQNIIGFHPGRLESHKEEIEKMSNELPPLFKKDSGDGWSFSMSCNDRNGEQWTDSHSIMEQLMLLGIAIGKVKYVFPREFWTALPDGMPYFVILP